MSDDRIEEVRKGERLRADTVNKIGRQLNDLTAVRPALVTAPSTDQGTAANLLRVRNDSSFPLSRYDVVGIASLDPARDRAAFDDGALYAVAGPPTATMPVVVAIEPIAAGAFGWVMTYGSTYVRVRVSNPAHRYADLIVGEHQALASADNGPFEMLQRDAANFQGQTVNAFVRFPAGTVVAGQDGGFRPHDHRDQDNGGFAFATYGPSGGAPQLPWD